MYSARPAVTPSPPPGNCRLCVTSNTTGVPSARIIGKGAHVDDQVVVAEGKAALGDEDPIVARIAHFGDRVADVERREELPLLEVDDAAGFRRGDDQIGLSGEKRRNLQDVGHFRRAFRLPGLMDVGEHRHAQLPGDRAEDLDAVVDARTAERFQRGPVGLVERLP
jgi:hypothetical protein